MKHKNGGSICLEKNKQRNKNKKIGPIALVNEDLESQFTFFQCGT
jgi:hypothetical protein